MSRDLRTLELRVVNYGLVGASLEEWLDALRKMKSMLRSGPPSVHARGAEAPPTKCGSLGEQLADAQTELQAARDALAALTTELDAARAAQRAGPGTRVLGRFASTAGVAAEFEWFSGTVEGECATAANGEVTYAVRFDDGDTDATFPGSHIVLLKPIA